MSLTPPFSKPPPETVGYSKTDPAQAPKQSGSPRGGLQPRARFTLLYYLLIFGTILLVQSFFLSQTSVRELAYSEFLAAVQADKVSQVVITQDTIYGQFKPPGGASTKPVKGKSVLEIPAAKAPWHIGRLIQWWNGLRGNIAREEKAQEDALKLTFSVFPLNDPGLLALLQQHSVEYRGRVESHWLKGFLLNWIIPLGVMILIWQFMMRRMGRGPGVLQMGQSKAKIYEVDPATRVHFSDIAGVDEAIEETREVVSFLKDPEQFTTLGAKLPKGVLLVGPPGTGKTLLARAIAGESEVAFFSLSGSNFVEMFVGVGAARVRDLFQEAKKLAPCIIFIDELDAIGKARAQGATFVTGGYDERENTLNQLLVEMDGFDGSAGVVILAATNRPEVLAPALLRPGRFDRRVLVDRPSREGRKAIFQIYLRKLPRAKDIDVDALAGQTPGMVGADIANVCNEAALLASRAGKAEVSMLEFQEGIERAIAGPQKKSLVVTPQERRRIAYHESGHALIGHLTPGGGPVQKISIIPRAAGSLGHTMQLPLEDHYLLTKGELLDHVRVLLAGRAAEDIVFGEISTGASDDLEQAGRIVHEMQTVYGMSAKVPNLSLAGCRHGSKVGFGFASEAQSEQLTNILDEEFSAILDQCYSQAKATLLHERERLENLAQHLLEAEELDRTTVLSLLGERPADTHWSNQ